MKRKDVVLAQVFFSDSNESKVRPAIIMSNEKYHESNFILVAAITTANDEQCLAILEKDVNCQLDKNSSAIFDGIIKIHKKQVKIVIGNVTSEFHARLVEKIVSMIKI